MAEYERSFPRNGHRKACVLVIITSFLWSPNCCFNCPMDNLALDIRVALRRLTARPTFAVIAILSLGLGIGATTIFFGLLNASLLKPLAVDRPEELVSPSVKAWSAPVVSYPGYLDIRDRSGVFDGVATYRMAAMAMSLGAGRNSRIWGYLAGGNFFSMLGVKAAMGRTLTPDDDRTPRGHPVAVLTHLGWQRRLGGAADAVGRAVRINGMAYRIVGVLPADFNGIERFFAAEIYVPMMMQPQIEPHSPFLDTRETKNTFIVARLKPAVTREQSERQLNVYADELARIYPQTEAGIQFKLATPGWGGEFLRSGVIGFTGALVGLAVLLVVVVCINLAGLLVARAAERRRETAVQLAIGAGRGQLVRSLMVESLIIAIAGGLLGLLIAQWGADAISGLQPPVDFSVNTAVAVDYRVVLFLALLTLSTTFLMGLLPALDATRINLISALKADSGSRDRRWPLRDILVAAQVALSVLIVGAASLVLNSLGSAIDLRPGFNPRGAAVIGFDLDLQGYDKARGRAFQKDLLAKIHAEPGVESVGFGSALPLDLDISNSDVSDAAEPPPPPADSKHAQVYRISSGFLAALQTRLVAGRDFNERDETGPQCVIVNLAFARFLFPSAVDPIGRRVRFWGKPHEIVGLVEDGKYISLTEAPRPVIYAPSQRYYTGGVRLVARTGGDPKELVSRLRQLAQEMDPDLAIHRALTLEEHMAFPTLPARTAGVALGSFGLLTLFLAAIGIYGVMAFAVARRTHELGIRIAIGANPRQVLSTVFERTGWMLAAGATMGLGLAYAARSLLQPLLLSGDSRNPLALFSGMAAIVAVTLIAAWIPARRAMSIEPSRALRHD